jgi:hypothetical protein
MGVNEALGLAEDAIRLDLEKHSRALPDPAVEPTITVARSASILGVSERSAHYAADRGEIPTVRVGRRRLVQTARFLAAFGLTLGTGDGPRAA